MGMAKLGMSIFKLGQNCIGILNLNESTELAYS
jgi:hypothetical protein